MEMIIGGSFQGKLRYAKQQHRDIRRWVDGNTCTLEELLQAEGVYDFQEFIRRDINHALKSSQPEEALLSISMLADTLIINNPSLILVSNEVGYGIVPMDARERMYRETVGRLCTQLTTYSSRVTRVVCGIGTVIKDA